MSDAKNLNSWLKTIEGYHPKTIDMGLVRVKEVATRANLLEFSCPVVTVAGTNGKGSTVATLAKLLQSAGLQVGTYTSPHLLRFNERIQINGQCATDEQLCEVFEKIERHISGTTLTFFEFTTLAAFQLFQESKDLDIVILEVGMGGRLDAVNLVSPSLAIITSISYDHEEWLGSTLEAIATEKAGILRPHIPVVLSTKAKMKTLLAQTKSNQNTLYIEDQDFGFINTTLRHWIFNGVVTSLPSHYLPASSVSLAMAAYTILGNICLSLPPLVEVANCLESVMMIGRFHVEVFGKITIIFDVAHNADGSQWLADKLHSIERSGRLIAVWASLADKALAEIIQPMKELVDAWCIGELIDVKRAKDVTGLQHALLEQGIKEVHTSPSIKEAFDVALKMAEPGDFLIIFGSFHTVSQVLQQLTFENREFQNNGLFNVFAEQIALRN